MPFFDFKCQQCQHQFTVRVSNAEKKNVKCPQCGTSEIKQLLSPFFTPGAGGGNACTGGSCSTCGPGCSCKG